MEHAARTNTSTLQRKLITANTLQRQHLNANTSTPARFNTNTLQRQHSNQQHIGLFACPSSSSNPSPLHQLLLAAPRPDYSC